MKYFIGIDIGTSAVKTVLTDSELNPLAQYRCGLTSLFPHPGWVEQDPEEIYNHVLASVSAVLQRSGLSAGDIAGIGLDHQGESCLIWEKHSGKPIYHVITWQDRRTEEQASRMRDIYGELIQKKTGQPADSYYSAFKLRWILDHTESEASDLLAGTLNTYIIWRMSEKKHFIIDSASATCTLLFDPQTNDWDPDLLRIFNIPRQILPQIVPEIGFPPAETVTGIPILATAPDSHAGMYGIGAVKTGSLITTYGTGNFMHLVTGHTFTGARDGLTSTILFDSPSDRIFQLNGICYTAGSAVKWLIDGLAILNSEKEASVLAKSVKDNGGIIFVPAFTGLATPFWDEEARGALLGLTAGASRAHIVRAVLESIALQVATVYEHMKSGTDVLPDSMIALGGMTANDFLMQFQADMLGIPVHIPETSEPCFGAAGLAYASLSHFTDPEDCPYSLSIAKSYEPTTQEEHRISRLSEWNEAVRRCLTSSNDKRRL